jgi:hypothetical protein
VFVGLVGLLITLLIARIVRLPHLGELFLLSGKYANSDLLPRRKLPLAIVVGGGTVLLASTLFLQYPAGLEGFGNALESYFKGWTTHSAIPALQPLVTLIAYQPLAMVFAIAAVIRGWLSNDSVSRWLSIWLLVVVFFSGIYPGRQVADIAWGLIPLWILAAKEIPRNFKIPNEGIPAFVLGGIVFVLCVLFWLMSLSPAPINLTWVILVIVPLLILLSTLLVGLGWSWDAARRGSIWGLSVAASLYVIAAMIGSSQLRFNRPEEFWTPSPGTVQAGLLEDSLSDLGLIQNGRTDWLDIVSTVDQSSLKWVLKSYSNVHFVSQPESSLSSPVIITSEDVANNPGLTWTRSYLGQDFLWSSKPGWLGVLPPDWLRWILNRQAPIHYESIVLWARSDFFPDQPITGSADSGVLYLETEEELLQEELIDK